MASEDLTGKRFGNLTVIRETSKGRYLCHCDCGNDVSVRGSELRSGHKKSCGCLKHRSRSKDITGVRSGKLVAVEPIGEKRNGAMLWRCQCDCGGELITESYKISSGVVKSCGCERSLKKIKDLTGQRFGKLTALERTNQKRGTSYLWRCKCDCGNEVLVTTNALTSGNTKSCGCHAKEKLRERVKNISGQRFGRLVAVSPTEKRVSGSVVWKCQCDCGNETEASYNSLVSGNVRSCGCLKNECQGPSQYMDYIDGTCVQNLEFKGLRKDNKSGCTGVSAYRGKWRAVISFKKKTYYLGTFEKKEDAIRIRKTAEEKLFGPFLDWYYSETEEGRSRQKMVYESEQENEDLVASKVSV